MSDLAAVQQGLEQACRALQDPRTHVEAERALLAFRDSSATLPACLHIVQHSTLPDARFQALLALRHSALASWPHLSTQECTQLRAWALQACLGGAGVATGVEGAIQQATRALAALLLKRQWAELPEQEQRGSVQELCDAASAGGPRQAVALKLLTAVVGEFEPSTASSLGLPLAYHEACRDRFEAHSLLAVFCAASAAVTGQPPGDPGAVAAAALVLLATVLGWDFLRIKRSSHRSAMLGAMRTLHSATLVDLRDGAWRAAVLAEPLLLWCVEAARGAAGVAGADCADGVGPALRHFIALVCAVANVGLQPAENMARGAFGVQAALALLDPARGLVAAADTDEAPLLDACVACNALCRQMKLEDLQRAAGGPTVARFAVAVAQTAIACVEQGGATVEMATEWQGEATSQLLEAWTRLLQSWAWQPPAPAPSDGGAHAAVAEATSRIVGAVLEATMQDLARGAEDEAGEEAAERAQASWEEEALDRIANLARCAAPAALPALAQAVAQRVAALEGGAQPPLAALEQLWWLLRLAACVLADSGQGEAPLVPTEITAVCGGSSRDDGAAVAASELGMAFCKVAAFVTQPALRARLSPRLLEAALWSLARWIDTYILPGEPLQPDSCPHLPEAEAVLRTALEASAACVMGFPGELELHTVVVRTVLHALVKQPVRSKVVASLPAWRELCHAFASQGFSGPMARMHSKLQRKLAQAICSTLARSDGGGGGGAAARSAGGAGQRSCEAELAELLHAPLELVARFGGAEGGKVPAALAEAVGSATVVDRVVMSLERLRGAVQGMSHFRQCAILAVLRPSFGALLTLQRAYLHHVLITALVFKLAAALVEEVLPGLEGPPAQELTHWCLLVLQAYSSWRRARPAGEGGSDAAAEAEAESAQQLKALLKLLASLSQSFDTEADTGLAEVVFQGWHAILATVTQPLLQYPAVAAAYFTFLLQLCELYPLHLAQLPPDFLRSFAGSLDWGMQGAAADTLGQCVQSIQELAEWHLHERAASRPGFAQAALPGGEPVLRHLLRSLLQQGMQGSAYAEGFLSQIAAAVLPIANADPASLVEVAAALLQGVASVTDEAQGACVAAVQRLAALAAEGGDTERLAARTDAFEKQFFAFAAIAQKMLRRN